MECVVPEWSASCQNGVHWSALCRNGVRRPRTDCILPECGASCQNVVRSNAFCQNVLSSSRMERVLSNFFPHLWLTTLADDLLIAPHPEQLQPQGKRFRGVLECLQPLTQRAFTKYGRTLHKSTCFSQIADLHQTHPQDRFASPKLDLQSAGEGCV